MTDLIKSAEIFARSRHAGQFRKGDAQEPYIVHVEEVAELVTAWGGSDSAIAAAWLHDTVEDCPPTSFAEIDQEFGSEVASIIREMTDDKSLPKAERKKLQILNAAKKSKAACLIKLADKSSNVAAIGSSPPADWSVERKLEYVAWARTVIAPLAYKPEIALQAFKSRCEATLSTIHGIGG
jgi:(p)ppGpp synthase/HD superfamily hydrolase